MWAEILWCIIGLIIGLILNHNVAYSKNNVLKREEISFNKTKAHYVRIVGKNTPVLPQWHPGAGKKTFLFLDEIAVQ